MKWLLFIFSFLLLQTAYAQSLDYISVRKKNGNVIKNFYTGSNILLQTENWSYYEGPIAAIKNDSVFITLYDIRMMPTIYGGFIRDTISTTIAGINYRDIKRIHIKKHRSFFERQTGPILMIAGSGYIALNVLNRTFFPLSENGNIKKLSIAAGVFGLGYLANKLFASDGFSKKKHQIVYVNLSGKI